MPELADWLTSSADRLLHRGLSGHSSVRMLERYTHPTNSPDVDALESFSTMGRNGAEPADVGDEKYGGRREARTRDLRVANAALSQLS